MSESPHNLADESVHGERGSNVTSIRMIAADKPLLTSVAIGLSAAAIFLTLWQHESDVTAIKEYSQWADLVYAHDLQMQADLKAMGIPESKLGSIPRPPSH